jgi:MFS family permease
LNEGLQRATPKDPPTTSPQAGLLPASWAVLLSAADTYVVVLVLPAMMASFGISLAQLERATPLVSGYLLGYTVALPLIGQLSDRLGRLPLFYFSFAAFSAGSVVTASSASFAWAVAGRAVQGLGGGAMLPLTFALAADRWGPERRSVPIGLVGAVQELGALLGPAYGALVVTFSSWQTIFWLNCPLTCVAFGAMLVRSGALGQGRGERCIGLAAPASSAVPPSSVSVSAARGASPAGSALPAAARRGALAGLALVACAALVVWQPSSSQTAWSLVPLGALLALGAAAILRARWAGRAKAASCLALGAVACLLLQAISPPSLLGSPLAAWLFSTLAAALSPLEWLSLVFALAALGTVQARFGASRAPRQGSVWLTVDYPGTLLSAGALAAIVVAFSTSNPSRAALPPGAAWVVVGAGLAAIAFVMVERRAERRGGGALVPLSGFSSPNAWGSLLANFALGAALVVVLVDVPLFARATTEQSSQLGAALVLVRFLAGVPVGAVAGGALARLAGHRWAASVGVTLAGAMLAVMSGWGTAGLATRLFGLSFAHASDPVLVLCGIGFGTTIAPLTTSLLNATPEGLHGLAASLGVVARMVGMVVGISLLTAVGLHAFSERAAAIPSPARLCPSAPLSCPRYNALFEAALVSELDTTFLSAALACAFALVVALATQAKQRLPAAG